MRVGIEGQSERDPDVSAVDQDVGQSRQRPGDRRAQLTVGALTQGGGDLRRRQLRAPPRQRVDGPMDAAVADRRPLEHPEAVGEHADQVGRDRLDVPSRAQALRRQLGVVELVDQCRDPAPLVGDGREDELLWIPASDQSNACRGNVFGMSSELSRPAGASITNGIAFTTRMAVAAIAARPAPCPSASPRFIAQWMSGSPSMSTR